ncbi:hypothetical protein PRO82_001435 [Candidatus Protochlamydia amoebophila]|nr:hypothetical protein [Candidatus Protochlamydia amoebophila]
MKRISIDSAILTRIFDKLIAERKLLPENFDKFEANLIKIPDKLI